MDNDKSIQIIDVRSTDDFKKLNLPKSSLFSLSELFSKDAEKFLSVKHKKNIFIANDELTSKRAAIIANKLGYVDVVFLEGGLNKFKREILEFKMPAGIKTRREADTFRFREKASKIIPVLIEQNKNKVIPKKESKRVIGGC
jgi:rhodanese-related sulfurtransferase